MFILESDTSVSDQLRRSVVAFREANPWVLDRQQIRAQCLQISIVFAEFLVDRGVWVESDEEYPIVSFKLYGDQPLRDVLYSDDTQIEPLAEGLIQHPCAEHHVLLFGDLCVDWTAHQFKPSADVPTIWPVSLVMRIENGWYRDSRTVES